MGIGAVKPPFLPWPTGPPWPAEWKRCPLAVKWAGTGENYGEREYRLRKPVNFRGRRDTNSLLDGVSLADSRTCLSPRMTGWDPTRSLHSWAKVAWERFIARMTLACAA